MLKKFFKILILLSILYYNQSSAYENSNKNSIDDIFTNPIYSDLISNNDTYIFYKNIESIKNKNTTANNSQLVKIINNSILNNENKYSINAYVDSTLWNSLNTYEKLLVATNPTKAYITSLTKEKAFSYTNSEFWYNWLGDKSDAFRHAIWNALMCKYIDKAWAIAFSTAHEQKSAEELKKIASDWNIESKHQKMDLHNNNEWRDSWFWNDSILYTTDSTLITRIKSKMKTWTLKIWELYWFNK